MRYIIIIIILLLLSVSQGEDLQYNELPIGLTEAEKNKIGDLQFCSTIPIFNGDQTKIRALLPIDSNEKMKFDHKQKSNWEEHMVLCAAFVDKHTSKKL